VFVLLFLSVGFALVVFLADSVLRGGSKVWTRGFVAFASGFKFGVLPVCRLRLASVWALRPLVLLAVPCCGAAQKFGLALFLNHQAFLIAGWRWVVVLNCHA